MKRKILKICSIIITCIYFATIMSYAAIQSTTHYKIDEGKKFITRIIPTTTVGEFKNGFNVDSSNISVKDADDNSNTKTAMKATITDSGSKKDYSLSVIDDLNDDGNGNREDTELMADHIIENKKLGDIEQKSADVNDDGVINQIDLFASVRYITDGELYIPEIKRPTSPTITVQKGKLGENEYYVTDVEVLIKKADSSEVPIKRTVYKIGEDDTEHEIDDKKTITLSESKIHTIYAYSYSEDGVKSQISRKTIKISKSGGSGETGATSKTAPTVISKDESSITIKLEQKDTVSGIASAHCRIREKGGSWSKWQTDNKFTGLTPDTVYEIQTKVKNNAGQETESDILTVTTDSFPIPKITVENPDTWTTSKKVTIQGKSGYSLYVAVGDEPEEKQSSTNATLTITKNTTVSAYLVDSKGKRGETATATVQRIDDADPTILGVLATKSSNKISIESRINDKNTDETNGSGIASVIYNIKEKSASSYDSTKTGTYNRAQTSHTFTDLRSNQEYDIQIIAQDNAGRKKIYTTSVTTNETIRIALEVENPDVWKTEKTVSVIGEIYEGNYVEMSKDAWRTSSKTSSINATLNNEIIYARVKDSSGNVLETKNISVTKIDDLGPTISNTIATKTTSKISVAASIKDINQDGSLGSGIASVIYNIKKKTAENYDTTKKGVYSRAQESHIFTGLENNQEYEIQIIAKDKVGRINSKTFSASTNDLVSISLDVENATEWKQKKKVSVKGSINEGDHIEMTQNDWDSWASITSTDVEKNNKIVHARVIDSAGNIKYSDTVDVTLVDDKAPEIIGTDITKDETSMVIIASFIDKNQEGENGSGIRETKIGIQKDGTDEYNEYYFEPSSSLSADKREHEFTGLETNKVYHITIKAFDNVYRITEKTIDVTTDSSRELSLNVENPTTWSRSKKVTADRIKITGDKLVMASSEEDASIGFLERDELTVSTNGTVVTAKIIDSTGAEHNETSITVDKIDRSGPTNAKPTNDRSDNSFDSIKIRFNQTDSASGLPDDEKHRAYYLYDESGNLIRDKIPFKGTKPKIEGLEQGKKYYVKTWAKDSAGNETISELSDEIWTPYKINYIINDTNIVTDKIGPDSAYPGDEVNISAVLKENYSDPTVFYTNGEPDDSTNPKGRARETTQVVTYDYSYSCTLDAKLSGGVTSSDTAIPSTTGEKSIKFVMPTPGGKNINVNIKGIETKTPVPGKTYYWSKRIKNLNKLNRVSIGSIDLYTNTITGSKEFAEHEVCNFTKNNCTISMTDWEYSHANVQVNLEVNQMSVSGGIKGKYNCEAFITLPETISGELKNEIKLIVHGAILYYNSGSTATEDIEITLHHDGSHDTVDGGEKIVYFRGSNESSETKPSTTGAVQTKWCWGEDDPPLYTLDVNNVPVEDTNIKSVTISPADGVFIKDEEVTLTVTGEGATSDGSFIYESTDTGTSSSTHGMKKWKYNYYYKIGEHGATQSIKLNSGNKKESLLIKMPAQNITVYVWADKTEEQQVIKVYQEYQKYTTNPAGHTASVWFGRHKTTETKNGVTTTKWKWKTTEWEITWGESGAIIETEEMKKNRTKVKEEDAWDSSPWKQKPSGASYNWWFRVWEKGAFCTPWKDSRDVPNDDYHFFFKSDAHSDWQEMTRNVTDKPGLCYFKDESGSIMKWKDGIGSYETYEWGSAVHDGETRDMDGNWIGFDA